MRVGLIIPEPLSSGGVSSYARDLIRMAPRDIDFTLIAQSSNDNHGFDLSQSLDRVTLVRLPPRKHDFLSNVKIQAFIFLQLRKICQEEKIEIIHTHFGHMPDIAIRVKQLKIPIIATAHNSSVILSEAIRSSRMSYSRLDKTSRYLISLSPLIGTLEKFYLRSRFLISPSRWFSQQLGSRFHVPSNKIFNIPNGIDTNEFKPIDAFQRLNDRKTIIFLGRISALKGIDVLCRAISILSSERYHLRLIIVGAGDLGAYRNELNLLRLKGVEIKCMGHTKREAIPEILASCDVALSASYIENASMSILEAMACGLPVIASDVGGTSEIITHNQNGLLFPSGDSEALSHLLAELLYDDVLRSRLGKAARKTVVESFNGLTMAKMTHDAYESILERAVIS
jgi:glycosyltransferase involved in cell wall biosynthesis